jgi:hypothetical protein
MTRSVVLAVFVVIGTASCVRREGRNANCVWPGEAGAQPLSPTQSGYGPHLSADAEFAEELADRYGLRMAGRGDPQTFRTTRQQCLEAMFAAAAKTHAIAPAQLSRYLGSNRTLTDVLLNLPFVLLYALTSAVMAKHIWKRYDGWLAGAALVLICALPVGVIGGLVGEQWSIIAESVRIGAGHLGIRASRLPWVRHRVALSACLAALFCVVAALVRRFPKIAPWPVTQDSSAASLNVDADRRLILR